jgi:hypothetical protein
MAEIAAVVTSIVYMCSKYEDLLAHAADAMTLSRQHMKVLKRAIETVADAHVKMQRLLSLAEEPMAQYDQALLLRQLQRLKDIVSELPDEHCSYEALGYKKRAGCLGRWCSWCGGQRHVRGYKAKLDGLWQAVSKLRDAVDAVQLSSIKIGGATPTLYQPPRQLAEVMKALLQGAELVVVSGGPAMGKSSLAREVKRRVQAAEVRESVIAL